MVKKKSELQKAKKKLIQSVRNYQSIKTGYNEYVKVGYNRAIKDVVKKIDEMLSKNTEIVARGKIIPEGVVIPFINGEELKKEITK